MSAADDFPVLADWLESGDMPTRARDEGLAALAELDRLRAELSKVADMFAAIALHAESGRVRAGEATARRFVP